ncbi:uncharacterized protein LOC127002253 [Eriocheir sinensis]|uniref:uncharacterized protein LOC127002253 n=1 Tax=Eriocheir sinensis TaxID=95602 RepID=UPI0021C9007D|nr:uncharacterized protein LOC127002253 [Eriocheir sinensis]XP_050724020.1 uncharacterized protein LOC127002253 [Eriocheir sinensis]
MIHSLITLLLGLATLWAAASGQQEGGGGGQSSDGAQHLTRCIKMAEPLVKSPDYIFPLTTKDIEVVCQLWQDFVYCVKEYAVTHLSVPHQQEFYQVIDSSIKSADELCRNDPEYMRAYRSSAPCLRRVSTNASLCGGQYRYMADVVQGLTASDAQVCCAHLKFRECVLQRTPRECDIPGGAMPSSGPPSRFMRSLLDRALGYLLQKCQNFVPNARDCPQGSYGDSAATTTTTTHTDTPTNLGFGSGGNGNSNSSSSHNHLNPNGPQNGPPTSTQTTRFTWTTPSTPSKATQDPSLSLGNSLVGAESQQYRGSSRAMAPSMALLCLLLLFLGPL